MSNPPVLIILSDKEKGKIFALTENVHFCGRALSNDINIHDPSVSSTHCKFAKTGSGTYMAIDLESTNGVAINGKLVKYAELKNKDILNLGNTQFLFEDEEGAVETIENTYVNTYFVPDGKKKG